MTAAADECIHLLDPATCTICNGRDRRERAHRPHPVDGTYPASTAIARFAGWCPKCREPIEPGETIVTGEAGWTHETCP